MFVEMLTSMANHESAYFAGERYEVTDNIGAWWVRHGVARVTTQPPEIIERLLARLDVGAGQTVLFHPFVGEFGHLVMTHLRIVHFSKAKRKIVCCRDGEQVLFPSADEFVTDWADPVSDKQRIATLAARRFDWADIERRYPDAIPLESGRLTPTQELHCINASVRLPFKPRTRGLYPDVVLGVRRRECFPERNWRHWQALADALRASGFTFAVMGDRQTSFDLDGQRYHTGDLDTDAAVESLQNCRLYVGTDSGGSHLAASVGSRMIVFRTERGNSRDLTPLMADRNPGRTTILPRTAWDNPAEVTFAVLNTLYHAERNTQTFSNDQ